MVFYTNFGDLPKENSSLKDSKITIIPVPYDKTSTWQKGADKGPEAIIKASANMELYDIETNSEVYKMGIYTERPITENKSPERMIEKVKDTVKLHLNNNKFAVTIGGEHSISIGAIEAHFDHFGKFSVLQLDAHSDLRDEYHGSKYNHACVMARAMEKCPIVQVGIRSMDSSEIKNLNKSNVFFAEDIVNNKSWIQQVISLLSEKVYITIDLDVFDISIMPATGTPEPGGLLWYDVLTLLKNVILERELIGFDVVELCPNKTSKPYDFLASKLIYKLLSYKFMEDKSNNEKKGSSKKNRKAY